MELLAFCVLSLGRQAPRVLAEEKPEASKETLRYLLKSTEATRAEHPKIRKTALGISKVKYIILFSAKCTRSE